MSNNIIITDRPLYEVFDGFEDHHPRWEPTEEDLALAAVQFVTDPFGYGPAKAEVMAEADLALAAVDISRALGRDRVSA